MVAHALTTRAAICALVVKDGLAGTASEKLVSKIEGTPREGENSYCLKYANLHTTHSKLPVMFFQECIKQIHFDTITRLCVKIETK